MSDDDRTIRDVSTHNSNGMSAKLPSLAKAGSNPCGNEAAAPGFTRDTSSVGESSDAGTWGPSRSSCQESEISNASSSQGEQVQKSSSLHSELSTQSDHDNVPVTILPPSSAPDETPVCPEFAGRCPPAGESQPVFQHAVVESPLVVEAQQRTAVAEEIIPRVLRRLRTVRVGRRSRLRSALAEMVREEMARFSFDRYGNNDVDVSRLVAEVLAIFRQNIDISVLEQRSPEA